MPEDQAPYSASLPEGVGTALTEDARTNPATAALIAPLLELSAQEQVSAAQLQEALLDLELAMFEEGWTRWARTAEREFSYAGLMRLVELSRLMYLKNPLIKRAVNVQVQYVFAQGLNIRAKHPAVNEVVQRFLDDRGNRRVLTSGQARSAKEVALQTDGNLFFALFTNSSTGAVKIRSIPVEQIGDIISNPDDQADVWLYKRQWTEAATDLATGAQKTVQRTAYYRDWRTWYTGRDFATKIGSHDVIPDAVVYHVQVGGIDGWKYGVPEFYAANDWARAAVGDLEDYATIRKALARFAWQIVSKGGQRAIDAIKAKLGTTLASDPQQVGYDTNPPPVVGSTFVAGEGTSITPMNTRMATPSPEDGRRLWLMVACGVGLPETFLGDASVGNHATAKTLDRPTELKMRERQTLWADVFQDLLGYVVDRAATAANGPSELRTSLTWPTYTEKGKDDGVILLPVDPETGDPLDRHLDVDFPSILDRDVETRVAAIVQAATMAGHPVQQGVFTARTLAGLLLAALGVDDVDEELTALYPDGTGDEPAGQPPQSQQPQPGTVPPGAAPGQQADPNAQQEPPEPQSVEAMMVEAVQELRSALTEIREGGAA